ncbi:MAG: sigma-54 dependent transcriptional regulator [Planctomycetota bacterium]
MNRKHCLLIVDDDPQFLKTASLVLSEKFSCHEAPSGEEAIRRDLSGIDAVLLDIELGRGMDGFQTLEALRAAHPDLPVMMISRREDIDSVVKATRLGACDYIGKSFNVSELTWKVERALSQRRLAEENRVLREEVRARFGRLVGDSAATEALRDEVRRAAAVGSPVLITGESGTGKELVARDIHELGPRARMPFVSVNCAAIPETLFESTLFGHERGAFTGADKRQVGRIEAAGAGTLFLDEVAEMPPSTQAKLLRVIQDRQFERLGSTTPIRMEARLVAASNRHVEAAVASGAFRQDLFYRLNVLRIQIRPLRDRLEDLLPLVSHILDKKAREMKRAIPRLSETAMQCLRGWHWPGNVRELENVLENALVHAESDTLHPEDFLSLQQGQALARDFATARGQAIDRFERQYLRATLRACKGNVSEAARRMNLSRYGLQKILQRLGMEVEPEWKAECDP